MSTDAEIHAYFLRAFDGLTVAQCGKEAPATQGLEKQLVQARSWRRLDEFNVDRAVDVNREMRRRDCLIRRSRKSSGNTGSGCAMSVGVVGRPGGAPTERCSKDCRAHGG
ncbi:hypothetical protein AB4Y32_32575 [Paraburkholderia phymatum]|uniref:Uncharacterized protein n=1 Tax=Paraburkholderia phymatum TaxID=148447 RepID=A0ACC6UAF9_9BURK